MYPYKTSGWFDVHKCPYTPLFTYLPLKQTRKKQDRNQRNLNYNCAFKMDLIPSTETKVYRYQGIFLKCAAIICTWVFIQRRQSCGRCIWGLIKSAHIPVQHPGHISNACSAQLHCWNMKYAWIIKSIWTIRLNIRYSKPSKRSLNLTHTCLLTSSQVHTEWHINTHSHVVHNGLSVLVPTFCWLCARSKK